MTMSVCVCTAVAADYLTLSGALVDLDGFVFAVLSLCLLSTDDIIECECSTLLDITARAALLSLRPPAGPAVLICSLTTHERLCATAALHCSAVQRA